MEVKTKIPHGNFFMLFFYIPPQSLCIGSTQIVQILIKDYTFFFKEKKNEKKNAN